MNTFENNGVVPEGGILYNILIVDDSKLCRVRMKHLCRMNERIGTVFFAKDGLEAIEIIRAHRDEIDGVLMDNHMPRLDGTHTVRQLREEESFDKLILGVTSSEGEDLKGFETSGVDYVFSKPFDKIKLEQFVFLLGELGTPQESFEKVII